MNDADYQVVRHARTPTGKYRIIWTCPFYLTWKRMLDRCYSPKYHAHHPTYADCRVCDAWLTFSNFKVWMETQDYKGKQLDKDMLVHGNKLYSEETCAFVTPQLNLFVQRPATPRDLPLGVYQNKKDHRYKNRYRATCNNPFTGRQEDVGRYATAEEAHEAWRKRKHELACRYADVQTDQRLATALRGMFAKH